MLKNLFLVFFFCFFLTGIYAQSDSLSITKSKPEKISRKEKRLLEKLNFKKVNKYLDTVFLGQQNILVGEIKSMDQTILILKTRYSKDDFRIKWYKVKGIRSNTLFIISLSNGKRLTSTINSIKGKEGKVVLDSGINSYEEDINNIIYLNSVGKSFVSRMKASFDVGYTMTKTNNLRQFTASANAGYVSNRWNSSGSFSAVLSSQDSIANVRRIDGDLDYQWILPKDWFLNSTVNFLTNDEQKLLLRTTVRLGAGYYFKHDNAAFFGVLSGFAYNNENYSDNSGGSKNSIEFYMGGALKKYKIGFLGLQTSLILSPSVSDIGRFRSDFKFEMKYDLIWDFYIKANFTYNFDNRPAEGASRDDYVLTTSFGWELK